MATLSVLKRFLQTNLDLDRTGGHVFARDDQTLILTDKQLIDSTQFRLIESTFPHVSVTVISSESSLSGFLVVFSCAIECGRARQRSYLRLALHLLCLVCAVYWTVRAGR